MFKKISEMVIAPYQQNNHCYKNESDYIWECAVKKLKLKLGATICNNYLSCITVIGIEGDTIILHAPNKFIRESLINGYIRDIRTAISDINKDIKRVDIRLNKQEKRDLNNNILDISLTPNFTFDNFIYDESNKVAYFAARQVSDLSDKSSTSIFKNLYIYGSVGMGKTHLAQAITHHVINHHPDVKVMYFTAERFMRCYVNHVRSNKILEFKNKLMNSDILILDDLQFICGKAGTEKEFISIFDNLTQNNKKVIVACNQLPNELNLDSHTKSRLAACFKANIEGANFALRIKILQHKLEKFHSDTTITQYITLDMLELLSHNTNISVREMEGALYKLITYCDLMGFSPNISILQNIIEENYPKNPVQDERKVTVLKSNSCSNESNIDKFSKIVNFISNYYNLSSQDIFSKRKSSKLSLARQMIVYFAKKLTSMTYNAIGQSLGNRTHSTVIYLSGMAQSQQSAIKELSSKLI